MTFTDHATVTRKDGGLKMRKRIVRAFVPGTERVLANGKVSGVQLLSDPSKMPSLSWSLPAGKSCPWALYGEGTICGGCYAQKGRYIMSNVAQAQMARFAWTRACLKSDSGREEFVSTLVSAIRKAGNKYFRVHDSGDLFSPDYVWYWVDICLALPEVTFWFPTRSWRVLGMQKVSAETRRQWALALAALADLPNVTMRPSALFFNAPAPRIDRDHYGVQMAAGSTACDEHGAVSCPARDQGNICGSCRACWDRPDQAISYARH